jgi:hypothetical protein
MKIEQIEISSAIDDKNRIHLVVERFPEKRVVVKTSRVVIESGAMFKTDPVECIAIYPDNNAACRMTKYQSLANRIGPIDQALDLTKFDWLVRTLLEYPLIPR